MASACIKMSSTDTFPTTPKYGWLSPRISFSRDDVVAVDKTHTKKNPDPDFLDFEFCSNDPTAMLTADELFSNGKLIPSSTMTSSDDVMPPRNVVSPTDTFLFSPKAPKCSSRWKELLGLKKLYHQSSTKAVESGNKKGLKNLLQRNTRTNVDSPSMRLPLLNELENDSVTVSARLSLSSSSSSGGHENEEFPRLSLDLDKPSSSGSNSSSIPPRNGRVRVVRHRSSLSSDSASVQHALARARGGQRNSVRKVVTDDTNNGVGLTADSPRMNSSGKIVFHSLERSSSSPSSFNGGQRYRHRGMERSYSANVRVTPVLNVPVCSLRRFPMFSQPKKENGGSRNEKTLSKNRSIEK